MLVKGITENTDTRKPAWQLRWRRHVAAAINHIAQGVQACSLPGYPGLIAIPDSHLEKSHYLHLWTKWKSVSHKAVAFQGHQPGSHEFVRSSNNVLMKAGIAKGVVCSAGSVLLSFLRVLFLCQESLSALVPAGALSLPSVLAFTVAFSSGKTSTLPAKTAAIIPADMSSTWPSFLLTNNA